MTRHWLAGVFAAPIVLAPCALAAESFPARPLRLIIPFPPGGGTDIIGRMLGHHLTGALGVQVVVDNRGGAAGIIGTEMATRADPDGHTLMIGSISMLCIVAISGARVD